MVNEKNIINKFNKYPQKRSELISSLDSEEISSTILSAINEPVGYNFYCSALSLIDDEEKLYKIVENILPKLNRDELPVRELQDYFSRFCIELNKKSLNFVVKTAFLCLASISVGECRAIFYKDILPICLKILSRNGHKSVAYESDAIKSCKDHRQEIINEILKKPFNVSILTNLVSMLKDIELTQSQQSMLIMKISENINQMNQNEIASLALVTFHITPYNQIIIPLLALDKYFLKRRYRYEFNEFDSTPDSVEETSADGMIQAEETVIYHFQSYAEFTTLEKDVTNALKNLEYAPNLILSPFLSVILVSIAKISSSNVQGNFRLNQSTILPFMKQIFKFNEEHRSILKTSGWARTIDPIDAVNTEPLLRILKQNTCCLKQDLALNGLFGLSFLLLKTKSSNELNNFAIGFLNEIIKNRPEFTSDIMHIIVKMLFCEKNKEPIIECFSSFMQNRYLDINASEPALKKLIEDLTELDLTTALSIENVIFAAITKSINLRNLMIDIMKKAMYQRNALEVRKMAILSFSIMLKKFTKTRSSVQPRFSHNISMFSLTQSQFAVNSSVKVRQSEIIMLEILGLMRRCFSETSEIKVMLYECLFNSISTNTNIIPYIVEFLDGHFRMYFECDIENEPDTFINFEKLFKTNKNSDEIIVMDELGHLLKYIINCIILTTEHHEKLNCDIEIYEGILKKLIEKCLGASMDNLHIFSTVNFKNAIVISQFLNCLEALMVYCCHRMKEDKENVSKIMQLFLKHQKIHQKAKKILESSKKSLKSDKNASTITKKNDKVDIKQNCIWNLRECSMFLKGFFSDNQNEKVNEMIHDKDFCKFVLEATTEKLKYIETSSNYTKMKYSRSIFESFLYTSKIIYRQLDLSTFKSFHDEYNSRCAYLMIEAFNYIICGMESSFGSKKEKWIQFLKITTNEISSDYDSMLMEVIERIQKIFEWSIDGDKSKFQDSTADTNISSFLNSLFSIIEVLYLKLEDDKNNRQCFNWILGICKKSTIKCKNLGKSIIKFLMLCISKHENALLIDSIAHKLAFCYKYRRPIIEPENFAQNNLSLIGKLIDETFIEFLEFMKTQLFIVEIYIKRANSFNSYICLEGRDSRHETCSHLQQIETAICTKLVSLGKSFERIASSNFPVTIKNIEKIVGIVNLYYKCLESLMKHFRKHYDIKKINYQCIGIEELIKYSKKFAICVYGIAPYVETSVDEEFNSKNKDKKEVVARKRDLVLSKATKLIPRMIFLIETFNKSVNIFDAAAKTNFNRFLHAGEIRDFHIRNSILIDALESSQTTARSQQIQNDIDEHTSESDEYKSTDDEAEKNKPKRKVSNKRHRLELSSSSDLSSDDEEDQEIKTQEKVKEIKKNVSMTKERFEKNVRILASKTRGRKKAK